MKHRITIIVVLLIFLSLVSCSKNEFWLIDKSELTSEQNPKSYTYMTGETEFTLHLIKSYSWFDEIYELTPDGQLLYSYNYISEDSKEDKPEVLILSEDEIKALFDYIVIDHEFYRWVKNDGINVVRYSTVRSILEAGVTTLSVTYNGETKTIGRYSNGWLSEEENSRTDNKTVKDIYVILKLCISNKKLVIK